MNPNTIQYRRLLAAVACASVVLAVQATQAAVIFLDETFDDAEWSTTKTLDTTPGSNATFNAAQSVSGGNPGAFRLIDMSNVNPTGGVVVAHLWTNAVYDPAVDGPIAGIGAAFDGRFLGGSAGTSQFGYHLFFDQDGSRYVASNLMWFAVAHGPGNGQQGSWTNFTFSTLDPTQFRLSTGGGPANPDLSVTGAPITFGFLTTTSASSIPVSVTGGVDNLTFTILGTNDADLAVSKVADPSPVEVGSNLTYTISVTNIGVVVASGVTVTDALPVNVTFVSASPGCTNIGGNVICDLGSITNGSGGTIDIVVVPTAAGSITNSVTVSSTESDVVPEDNTAQVVTTVIPEGDDLAVDIEVGAFSCTNTPKGTTCTTSGTVIFANNGVEYGTADFDLSITDSTKPDKPPKIKFALNITNLEFDLGANPSATINVYLSDDATFDGSDTPLIKPGKEPTTALFDSLAQVFKTPKLKAKIPKSTSLSGKFLLVVIDFDDQVDESNEDNNVAVIGPLP